ncbi:MAG TPA: phosphate ABC transporter substrate-binding protein PstS [Kofleriaceae bacterium]|jgi:phosphate transport system substrate-binding protein|nr:phosphate ABC transporter substrate-binding protein PstS [Kofleriaceae bacterium]
MNRTLVVGALAAVSLLGCKKKDDASATGALAATLDASGATFQKAFQEVAIEEFTATHKQVTINYGAGGSGKGRQDFADKIVDFACTDAPYKPEDAGKVKGGAFLYIPNVLGAITLSYNLDSDKLQLSPDVIAKIFQREITRWNDPAIAADNPGVTLPDLAIVVAHRSDGSGTTENFTRYLSLAAPTTWKLKSGSTVEWSADTQAGNGNGGVAQIVKSTKGAIGYVDLSDAKASGLKYAAVKNQAGKYIAPSVEATTAAGEGIEVQPDLLFSALNAKGDAAYPITAQSWCLVYEKQTDKAKGEAVKAYFKYMLTDGQKLLPEIDFAPLPKSIQDKALTQLEKVQVPAS